MAPCLPDAGADHSKELTEGVDTSNLGLLLRAEYPGCSNQSHLSERLLGAGTVLRPSDKWI